MLIMRLVSAGGFTGNPVPCFVIAVVAVLVAAFLLSRAQVLVRSLPGTAFRRPPAGIQDPPSLWIHYPAFWIHEPTPSCFVLDTGSVSVS